MSIEQYQKALEDLQDTFRSFVYEATAGSKNQAAALRCRKITMTLRSDLKKFRNLSLENDELLKNKNKSIDE